MHAEADPDLISHHPKFYTEEDQRNMKCVKFCTLAACQHLLSLLALFLFLNATSQKNISDSDMNEIV